jgi:hypothetical protein
VFFPRHTREEELHAEYAAADVSVGA